MAARWLGALAGVAAVILPAAAAAQSPPQTTPQALFESTILADPRTTPVVAGLLRSDAAHVSPRPTFTDLTGDRREDAVVGIGSGGAAGTVAVYVLSSDGTKRGRLRVVFRSQSLYRAQTRTTRGTFTVLQPQYATGDDLCCPAGRIERDYVWNEKDKRLRHRATTKISLRD